MNLIVNCNLGTTFFRSIQIPPLRHDGSYTYKLVDKSAKKIVEKLAVQNTADNATNWQQLC